MTLGEKLLYLRKNKGLTQEQLAAQVTVSRQAVSKWELDESSPDTDNIVQLTKIFNVTADFLLNDEIDIPAGLPDGKNEKELTDDSDGLVLKTRRPKKQSEEWLPILFSAFVILAVVIVYVLFFR